jgi:glycerol-3-phosphate acyltransferase PlsY
MYFLFLSMCLILAYLAGSINFAILISRWIKGIDIRAVGNRNPGTANVSREVGRGWAALVLVGDLAKGLIPLFLAKAFLFSGEHYADYFALLLTGIAAIAGHCWPLYHGFKGGRGMATSIGIFMFFIPVEFFAAMLLAFLTVQLLFRNKKYSVGQLTPMIFVPLSVLLVILSSLFLDTTLFNTFKTGGHPWYVVASVMILSAYIIVVNRRIVQGRLSKEKHR